MPDIPEEAVQAALAHARSQPLLWQYISDQDVRELLQAAAPVHAAQVRRQVAEQIAADFERRAEAAAHEARQMTAYGARLQAEMASSKAGVFADGAAIARRIGEARDSR